MRILFASAHPYLPEIMGGSQVNTHEMALALAARGHAVAVLAGLIGVGLAGLVDRLALKVSGRQVRVRESGGYEVYRGWHAWEGAAECVEKFRPDIAVVQSGSVLRVAGALRATGVPILIYNHNVDFADHGAAMEMFETEAFVANSHYTAQCYRQAYGVESDVIVPFFDRSRYAVESRREDVLFINPHPQKGAAIALDLARRFPDIPFRFVRGWPLGASEDAALLRAVNDLCNVRIFEKTDQMRQHYSHARLLLVPSQWNETWGRVATEAQFSGIPVLATRIGGIPEAIGAGGVLVDPEAGSEAWATALQTLWYDQANYDRLAAEAFAHAERAQINPERQLDDLERAIARAQTVSPGRTASGCPSDVRVDGV